MVGLLVLLTLAFVALIVVGALSSVLWFVFMPFRIVGWMLKGVGGLIALPFMLLFGALAVMIFGFGALLFLFPFLPFALLAVLLWRVLARPRHSSTVST